MLLVKTPLPIVRPTLHSSAISMALAPPVAYTAGQAAATAIGSGVLAVCAQAALVVALRRSNESTLKQSAGYIAHHIIALAFMVVATVVGFAGWFSPAASTSTAAARLLVPDGTARWLGAMLFGELLLWDFPCSLFIKKLQVPVIVGHHIGLLATATLALVAPIRYGTFYLGWAELSNIPLQLIDMLEHAQETGAEAAATTQRRLSAIREAIWPIFCASFFVVRVVLFTAVTARGLVPDILATLPTAGSLRRPLQGFLGLGTAFNALMLFWFAEAGGKALGLVTWDSGVSSGKAKE